MLRIHSLASAFALLAFVCGLGLVGGLGCDRPFVEEAPPTISIVTSDLSTVRAVPEATIEVAVESSLRAIDTVRVNGVGATFDPNTNVYRTALTLERGVNALQIEARDISGNLTQTTRYAVYLPARFRVLVVGNQVVRLPAAVGGHTATLLQDGRVLVTGGAEAVGGPATDAASLYDPATGTIEPTQATMQEARVGHTATRLSDGRVLIAGGARLDQPTELSDLVNDIEIFDPETQQFQRLSADPSSPPIERTEHAAHIVESEGRPFLYLLGGRGRISFNGTTFGTRSDFRVGELVALGFGEVVQSRVNIGPTLTRSQNAVSAFTFSPLRPTPSGFGEFLLAGTYAQTIGGQAVVDSVARTVSFSFDTGYDDRPLPPMTTARVDHAAALVEPGLVLLAGGQVLGTGAPVPEAEVFAEEAGRFFPFPLENEAPRLNVPRYGHTATKIADDRILFLGGFDASGRALDLAEVFEAL